MYPFFTMIVNKRFNFCIASLVALTCVVAISCSSDDEESDPVQEVVELPPDVITSEAADITRIGAVLKGTIKRGVGYDILEQGFVFLGSQQHPDSTAVSISGSDSEDISYFVDSLEANTTYSYQAYANVAKRGDQQYQNFIFGNKVQFTTPKATFSIDTLWPGAGAPGDTIWISGRDYGSEVAIVKFGTAEIEIVERSSSTIKFKVPEGFNERLINVSVTLGGTTIEAPVAFNLQLGSWEQLSDAPIAAAVNFNFTIGDEVFIGFNSDGTFYSYKPITGEWTQRENAPLNVMCAFPLYDSQGYVITSENDVYLYSPVGGWLQLNDFPGVARLSAFGFSVDNIAYAGAGRALDKTPLNDFWEYDPGEDSWARKSDFPGIFNIQAGSSFGLGADGKAYVFNKPELWVYTPVSDSWEQKQSFPIDHLSANPRGFVIDDKLFFGGMHRWETFYIYESTIDRWLEVYDMPEVAEGVGFAFSFDGKGYTGCGKGALNLPGNKKVWRFTP